MKVAGDRRVGPLSPRHLAQALGVSESTVKRWIDSGVVPARRTSGGHRRVELTEALRFLRKSGRELARPDLLGLPASAGRALEDPTALHDSVFELLLDGRRRELARLLLAAVATGGSNPAALFDGPLRSAMTRIGELWRGSHEGIYIEHRATRSLLHSLERLEGLFDPPADAPVAVGGSVDGDPSIVPTRMAAIVLAAAGVRAIDLGADTPPGVLLEAADRTDARLVWVSVGHVTDPHRQSEALTRLGRELEERGVRCIVGGREVGRLGLGEDVRVGGGMSDLADIARELSGERRR